MAKILLIRPINPSGSAYLRRFGFLPAPLGLMDLASEARMVTDTTVNIIDMEADSISIKDITDRVAQEHYDIVGITIHATSAHNVSIAIANGIKESNKEIIVVGGGHHATFVPKTLLKNGFDVIALGEGDETFYDLVDSYHNGEDFSRIPGILYKVNDSIKINQPRKLIHDLDSLPMPAFDLVDPRKYTFKLFGEDEAVMALETSRGCPYACDFCSVTPTWGNVWRNKSVNRVMDELRIINNLGYKWVFFVDDIFVVQTNVKQRNELFDRINEENIRMKYIVQMRADVTSRNPDLIKKGAESGITIAFIGAESGSEEVLKRMHKGVVTDQTISAIRILKQNGIITLVGMMMGAPYEKFKDVMNTIRFSKRLAREGADAIQFSIYTPLPGTRIMRDAILSDDVITTDWDRYDVLTPVAETRISATLSQLMQIYAAYSFYLYKYIIGRLGMVNKDIKENKLVEMATKYMMKDLPEYLKDVISVPKILMDTRRLIREGKIKGRIDRDVLNEILSFSSGPIYDLEGKKNPYFMIKEKQK